MGGKQRQDHYEVLGVNPDAPDEVIRAAYRALVSKYHPDRNAGDRDAELKLKRLNAAWAVLGDAAKRRQYDELTESPTASDEPDEHQEPPRWKVAAEEALRPEPRWKHPAQGGDPSRSAPLSKGASAGGRVVGWIMGAALLIIAIIAFAPAKDRGCEQKSRAPEATTPLAARSTAQPASPSPTVPEPQPVPLPERAPASARPPKSTGAACVRSCVGEYTCERARVGCELACDAPTRDRLCNQTPPLSEESRAALDCSGGNEQVCMANCLRPCRARESTCERSCNP